jgi:AAA+ superfamily predicted ATPase
LRQTAVNMLCLRADTDVEDLACFLATAARRAPALAILEDLDLLTKECPITRAALLGQLDGLASTEAVLIIGTTNHPATWTRAGASAEPV